MQKRIDKLVERSTKKTKFQGNKYMKNLQRKVFESSLGAIFTFCIAPHIAAEEKVIQQEKLSYEKCLKVITTSQDKLSVAPEIENVSDQKRIAVFTLIDGTLTITCDREDGSVKVSTNTN